MRIWAMIFSQVTLVMMLAIFILLLSTVGHIWLDLGWLNMPIGG